MAVDEEPGGGEAQGAGPRGGELEAPHPLHLKHPHATGQPASGDHLREDVQRAQVCAERQQSTSWRRRRWPAHPVPLQDRVPASPWGALPPSLLSQPISSAGQRAPLAAGGPGMPW